MENLKLLREKVNLSIKEAASIFGVSAQAIGKWERGEGMPRSEKLVLIADTYKCSIDQLFGRDTAASA